MPTDDTGAGATGKQFSFHSTPLRTLSIGRVLLSTGNSFFFFTKVLYRVTTALPRSAGGDAGMEEERYTNAREGTLRRVNRTVDRAVLLNGQKGRGKVIWDQSFLFPRSSHLILLQETHSKATLMYIRCVPCYFALSLYFPFSTLLRLLPTVLSPQQLPSRTPSSALSPSMVHFFITNNTS